MSYQPIADYGIIGDTRTVALIGKNGSLDWFCFPDFDSPSVFGSILDDQKGGRFQIEPVEKPVNRKQFYWPDTNVLVTRFFCNDGVTEVIDYMPIIEYVPECSARCVVRTVNCVSGTMKLRMTCAPAFNYARDTHEIKLSEEGAAFHTDDLSLGLATSQNLEVVGTGVVSEFELNEQMEVTFVLREITRGSDCGLSLNPSETEAYFHRTVQYWRNWISRCSYNGRWREMVERSALVLKLLTYEPTGAIVAAPTTSLPEHIGGQRNWDYRYTWIRDAAFTVYGLLRIGFTDEAAKFMEFIKTRCHELNPDDSLQIMYGIDGRHDLKEETLDHLEGYMKSGPVRIGNAAFDQLQLDIYGELMDSVYLFNKYGSPIEYDLWKSLRQLTNWIARNWHRKDEGIWEIRGGQHHFVYSKLMSWVALDRAIRLADKRSFPSDRDKWLKIRDKIYLEIMNKGWSDNKKAFIQAYDSEHLDASNLIMSLVFFLSPTDPRNLQTLDAVLKTPAEGGLVSNSLVHRYNLEHFDDGLEGEEGTFNMCSFWLVEALTRAGRVHHERLDQARLIFERMLGYSNHLGLYAEETGPCGDALGNFPQAFTHLSLISAAYNLDRALGKK